MKPPRLAKPRAKYLVLLVLVLVGIVSTRAIPFGGWMQDKPKEVVFAWDRPAVTPKWLADHPKPNLVEEKIRQALNEKIHIDFDGLSVNRIIKVIRGKFDIPIEIDTKSLDEQNDSPEQTLALSKMPTDVRSLLTQILRPRRLSYVVESEALRITDFERAHLVRHYDLSYLFPDNAIVPDLIGAIEMAVYANEWQCAGGTASISLVGSQLAVKAPEEVHTEIERFLRSIGNQAHANMRPRTFVP